MLYAAMLTAPTRTRASKTSAPKSQSLAGRTRRLDYKDVKRVVYATGGQSYPNPPPYDQVSWTTGASRRRPGGVVAQRHKILPNRRWN